MNAVTKIKPDVGVVDPLAKMREAFPDNQISKLPKESRKQADERKAGQNSVSNCPVCGGWHHKNAAHLDYVGHAALTDRLLDADPRWNWKPMAYTPEGLPAFDKSGGLWVLLTIDDVTRIGYGCADGKTGGDAIKEIIGDALRNSGMRFGAALDLWHKGDLHAHDEEPALTLEDRAIAHLKACAIDKGQFKDAWESNRDGWKKTLDRAAYERVVNEMMRLAKTFPKAAPVAEESVLSDGDIPEQFR